MFIIKSNAILNSFCLCVILCVFKFILVVAKINIICNNNNVYLMQDVCPSEEGDSSQLAAAIILSAPPKRRQVFLQASSTGSDVGGATAPDKAFKRRTWHVDRVVRVIALDDNEEEGTSSLPSLNRSTSSDSYHKTGKYYLWLYEVQHVLYMYYAV